MKIEIRDLMNENEMLSHIFLGCIPTDDLLEIRDNYMKDRDWENESITIPVELKIGDTYVNPKAFFDAWQEQISDLIYRKAKEIVKEKIVDRMYAIIDKIREYQEVIESWEEDINWEVENPLI